MYNELTIFLKNFYNDIFTKITNYGQKVNVPLNLKLKQSNKDEIKSKSININEFVMISMKKCENWRI